LKSVLGSRVGAAVTDSARAVVPIVMQLQGLDASKIQWRAASNQTYISLLLADEIDSFSASTDSDIPALEKLLKSQGKKPYFSSFADWGYDGLGFLLIASNDRMAKNPEEVKAFAAAVVKGVQYSIAHPEEAAQIMIKYSPTLDPEVTLEQWRQTVKALDTSYVKEHGLGVITNDRVQRSIDLTREAFKFEGQVSPDQVFTPGFVANAK
jgi:NitT/TauT family transport system substrate-binding protein